jgi:crotonobetainyl-CoA:carnitine CoA-transferase CaiB-like acyl-CoA transferase
MVAGPVACTFLSDFGAEVIKVEQPGTGDTLRGLGPFKDGESLWWNLEGRNKKSVTLDLRTEQGQQILKRLVCEADAVVENFRPGTLENWNIGYSELAKLNPRLVMLSVSGFGQTGPYAKRAGYDRVGLAFSGVMGMTGLPDTPPVRVGISVADYSTAALGAFAVMMALYHRDVTGGPGQQIDLSLYETMFRFTDTMVSAYDQLGMVRQRTGNVHQAAAPGNNFQTKDGRFIVMTISGDVLFKKLCRAIGREDAAVDVRFENHETRWQYVHELNSMVSDWMASRDADVIAAALNEHGVPFSIIYSVEDIFQDPHYLARENVISVEHPTLGNVKMPGVVPRMSATPSAPPQAAPALGAHNEEVFMGLLGMQRDEFDQLRSSGVI